MTYQHEHNDEISLRAKKLRQNMTKEEIKLWNFLKNNQLLNLKFRRQVPIGNYIVDFLCHEKKLIIELDGGQHNEPENIEYDKQRTAFLEKMGYKVLRFWNNDVWSNFSAVTDKIKSEVS